MRAVAGAEPAAKVAGFANGDAAEVGAYACCLLVVEVSLVGGLNGKWDTLRKGVPIIISHSGFLTRSESGCGSRSDSHFVSSASLISSAVRCRTKTGLPRHLMIT